MVSYATYFEDRPISTILAWVGMLSRIGAFMLLKNRLFSLIPNPPMGSWSSWVGILVIVLGYIGAFIFGYLISLVLKRPLCYITYKRVGIFYTAGKNPPLGSTLYSLIYTLDCILFVMGVVFMWIIVAWFWYGVLIYFGAWFILWLIVFVVKFFIQLIKD